MSGKHLNGNNWMPNKERPLLAKAILWTGITERQTCCFLCGVTMTVLAAMLALFAAGSLRKACYFVLVGAMMDAGRAAADRLLGRPGVRWLNQADTYVLNPAVMTWAWWVYRLSVVGLVAPAVMIGIAYMFSAPLEGARPTGLIGFITHHAPDLTGILAPIGATVQNLQKLGYPQRAEVVQGYLVVLYCNLLLTTLLGVVVFARLFALELARDTRHKGFKDISDRTPIVAMYIFLMLIVFGLVWPLASEPGNVCSRSSLDVNYCTRNWSFKYTMIPASLIASLIMVTQAYIEAGCHEKRPQ